MGDLRTKRTYLLLKNALLELLSKKAFEEIKVNDICNLAMIHRTTFYSHFSDKYELLEYCISDIEEEITHEIKKNSYSDIQEFYTNMIMGLLDYIRENKKFFKTILKKNSDNGVIQIFSKACISYIQEMLKQEEENGIEHDVPIEIISQFFSGAVISTIIWWIKTNSNISPKDLCEYLIKLIFNEIGHK